MTTLLMFYFKIIPLAPNLHIHILRRIFKTIRPRHSYQLQIIILLKHIQEILHRILTNTNYKTVIAIVYIYKSQIKIVVINILYS